MTWTKAKVAIVVGTGALLVAGTATVVVNKFAKSEPLSPEDAYLVGEDAYLVGGFNGYFRKAPPALFVRTTHFPQMTMAYRAEIFHTAYAAGRNVSFQEMFGVAYMSRPCE